MTTQPSHEQLREMLPAAALEILDPEVMEQITAHTDGCPECAELLREYHEVAAGLSLSMPAQRLDPARASALRSRLVRRARTEPRAATPPLAKSRRTALWLQPWTGWMVAAGLTGLLLVHHSVHRTLDYGWLAAGLLLLVLICVGVYTRTQRARIAVLEARLSARGDESKGVQGGQEGPHRSPSSILSER